MTKTIIAILLVSVVFIMGCTESSQPTVERDLPKDPNPPTEKEKMDPVVEEEEVVVEDEMSEKITFVLSGVDFKFFMDGKERPEIRVKQGDTVRIEFTSTQGYHDLVVDEFDAATKQVRPNDGMTSVEFVADQKGTFEYYCSVGQHRAQGMWGNLVVE